MSCPSVILDTNLDPLGDGSLYQSFTFNDNPAYNDEQGISSFDSNLLPGAKTSYTLGGVGAVSSGTTTSTNTGHGISGSVDASWYFRLRAGSSSTARVMFSIGGDGQRYNAQIYSDGTDLYFRLHKNNTQYNLGVNLSSSSEYTKIAITYNASTEETKCYVDSTLKATHSFQMKWDDGKPYQIDATTASNIDQLMCFKKTLTPSDIDTLDNNIQSEQNPYSCMSGEATTSSSGVILPFSTNQRDYFNDGSCLYLFRLDGDVTSSDGTYTIPSFSGNSYSYIDGGSIDPSGKIIEVNDGYFYDTVAPSRVFSNDLVTGFAMSASINFKQFLATGDGINKQAVIVNGTSSMLQIGAEVSNLSDTQATIIAMNGSGSYLHSTVVDIDKTYFIALSIKNNIMTLYVDGEEAESVSVSSTSSNGKSYFIGSNDRIVVVDQLRSFNRGISKTEVQALMTEGDGLPTYNPSSEIYGSASIVATGTKSSLVSTNIVAKGVVGATGSRLISAILDMPVFDLSVLANTASFEAVPYMASSLEASSSLEAIPFKTVDVTVQATAPQITLFVPEPRYPPYGMTYTASIVDVCITVNSVIVPCDASDITTIKEFYDSSSLSSNGTWTDLPNISDDDDYTFAQWDYYDSFNYNEFTFDYPSGTPYHTYIRVKQYHYYNNATYTTLIFEADGVEFYRPYDNIQNVDSFWYDEEDLRVPEGSTNITIKWRHSNNACISEIYYYELIVHEETCSCIAQVAQADISIGVNEALFFTALPPPVIELSLYPPEIKINPSANSEEFSIVEAIDISLSRGRFSLIGAVEQDFLSKIIVRTRI